MCGKLQNIKRVGAEGESSLLGTSPAVGEFRATVISRFESLMLPFECEKRQILGKS